MDVAATPDSTARPGFPAGVALPAIVALVATAAGVATSLPPTAVYDLAWTAAALGTLLMGLAANYPIALAPLMGENAFFAAVVVAGVAGSRISWEVALGAVCVSGILFVLLTLLRVRELIIDAVPGSLKHAIASGIGLFIVFIGLVNAGIIVRRGPEDPTLVPVALGDLGTAPPLLALGGTLLIAVLLVRRVRGAIGTTCSHTMSPRGR